MRRLHLTAGLGFLLIALGLLSACLQPAPTAPAGPDSASKREVSVIFFDVGESGDGFLVSTWEGKHLLIDGGRRNSNVAERLKGLRVPQIDVMIATNPDADHIGGLVEVLRTMPVKEVWLSGDINTTIVFEDFVDAVELSKAKVHAARQGDIIRLGSLSLEVLSPMEPLFPDRNNNSVAVRLEFGRISFMFTGDMEQPAESRLVQSGINLKSTFLKLGHHGSRTSTSPAFLAAVSPQVAIYQAGANNRYGHPHRETLALLDRAGVEVYGTGVNGQITIRTDGISYSIETER